MQRNTLWVVRSQGALIIASDLASRQGRVPCGEQLMEQEQASQVWPGSHTLAHVKGDDLRAARAMLCKLVCGKPGKLPGAYFPPFRHYLVKEHQDWYRAFADVPRKLADHLSPSDGDAPLDI